MKLIGSKLADVKLRCYPQKIVDEKKRQKGWVLKIAREKDGCYLFYILKITDGKDGFYLQNNYR